MARLTHEEKVERFYSHGADLRAAQEGGLLSFGYWTESTVDYRQATEDLLARVGKGSLQPSLAGVAPEVLDAATAHGAWRIVARSAWIWLAVIALLVLAGEAA